LELPSWKVPRLWSRKLGLSEEPSEEVDKIVGLEEGFEGFKVGHDWMKGPSREVRKER
jgi:hypothetical protein